MELEEILVRQGKTRSTGVKINGTWYKVGSTIKIKDKMHPISQQGVLVVTKGNPFFLSNDSEYNGYHIGVPDPYGFNCAWCLGTKFEGKVDHIEVIDTYIMGQRKVTFKDIGAVIHYPFSSSIKKKIEYCIITDADKTDPNRLVFETYDKDHTLIDKNGWHLDGPMDLFYYEDSITQTIKQDGDSTDPRAGKVINLSGKTPAIKGGQRPTGVAVHGRRFKATVVSRHYSYREIHYKVNQGAGHS